MRFIDISGEKYGRLKAMAPVTIERKVYWYCLCSCGNKVLVKSNSLRTGNTKSCGCFRRETVSRAKRIHGHARPGGKTKTYTCWRNMLARCDNPGNTKYADYGGRGIRVCKRWYVFENFLEDMGECPTTLTLDRKNNASGYSKRNCQWVSRKVQCNNQRTNHTLTFRGKTQTLAEWSDETGIPYGTLISRINRYGWPVKRALTT